MNWQSRHIQQRKGASSEIVGLGSVKRCGIAWDKYVQAGTETSL